MLSFLEQALMGIGQGHTLLNVSTFFNPLTPMSDQEKTSPYNISKMSSRKVNTKFSQIISLDCETNY